MAKLGTTGKKGETPVLPVMNSPSHMPPRTPSRRWRPTDPITPLVSGLVRGIRFDGPVRRYRLASKILCRLASVLGWTAVVIGAGEIAIGVVLFSKWRREGGWWAGLLGALLGMVATGITADTPVGTPLVGWLVVLGLVSLLTSLVTLLALDGATWLDAKGVEVCVKSFDLVCQSFDCACSTSDDAWDKCFSPGNGDCGGIESAPPVLLASSFALLVLSIVSALLLAAGIKIKYLGGGVAEGGETEKTRSSHPAMMPSKNPFPETPEPGNERHRHQHRRSRDEGKYHNRGQQPPRGLEEAKKTAVGAEYEEEQKKENDEDGVAVVTGAAVPKEAEEAPAGAEPWAVGYVDRLAGGGNKKRRDELNNPGRGGGGGGGGRGSVGAAVSQ